MVLCNGARNYIPDDSHQMAPLIFGEGDFRVGDFLGGNSPGGNYPVGVFRVGIFLEGILETPVQQRR